jgi:hypothetical protein
LKDFEKWKYQFIAFPLLFLKEQIPSPTNGLYWTFMIELKIVKHEERNLSEKHT